MTQRCAALGCSGMLCWRRPSCPRSAGSSRSADWRALCLRLFHCRRLEVLKTRTMHPPGQWGVRHLEWYFCRQGEKQSSACYLKFAFNIAPPHQWHAGIGSRPAADPGPSSRYSRLECSGMQESPPLCGPIDSNLAMLIGCPRCRVQRALEHICQHPRLAVPPRRLAGLFHVLGSLP